MPGIDLDRVQAALGDCLRGEEASPESFPALYDALHAVAVRFLGRERIDHTLQPTALVHEAYLRLSDQEAFDVAGKTHVVALGALMMRRVLVDHAKAKRAAKRGGDLNRVQLQSQVADGEVEPAVDVLALDEALSRLAKLSSRQSRIVELRYFGGVSVEETATLLGVSLRTVHREWILARAWLRSELER